MRQNVLQARNVAEEADAAVTALELQRPATSCGVSTPSGVSARRPSFVVTLGQEAMQAPVTTWVPNALSTPKNCDRRDMVGSVESMTPLWRGSGAESLHFAVARQAAPVMTSPTGGMTMGYPRADGLAMTMPVAPATPSSLSIRAQAPVLMEDGSALTADASLLLGTPKNSERLDASGRARVMMPRSSHSIRNTFIQASAGEDRKSVV